MQPLPRSASRLAAARGPAACNEDRSNDTNTLLWPCRNSTEHRYVKHDLDEMAARLSASLSRTAKTARQQIAQLSASVRRRSAIAAIRPDVTILEVGPRDGLQNIKTQVPTQIKVELIRKLANTGLRNIEATSFVSPKWIPQLADSKDVLTEAKAIGAAKGIWMPVLTPNTKGLELAIENGAQEVVVFASASEAFSKANTNCTIEEAMQRSEHVVKGAMAHGIRARGVISCIVACPYDGPTDPAKVLELAKRFLAMGCYEVGLGDTIGVATPHDIEKLLRVLLTEIPADKLAGHYHDTYGQAIANVVKSFEMGLTAFDSSVAGLGGCPYAKGAKGNLATEDLVYTFEKAGIKTGVDLQQLSEIGDWISREVGIPNNSRAGSAIVAKSRSTNADAVNPVPQSTTRSLRWTLVDNKGDYRVRRAGNILKVTLTRPKNGNALTNTMVEGITHLFHNVATDPSIFTIVLDAQGKYFCTGMDLSSKGSSASNDASEKAAYYEKVEALFQAIDKSPQITISVVDGPCYGGGVGLAFVCDVRLVSEKARFTMTEVKLGLSPAIISKYMVREWGFPLAREAMLAGREVTPEELQTMRIVHETARDTYDLEQRTDSYLEKLSKSAPQSAAAIKELVRLGWREPGGKQQQDYVTKVFAEMMQPGSEGEYGLAQFRKKVRGIDWGHFWAEKGAKVPPS